MLPILALFIGILVLLRSADWFVAGAAAVARIGGVSPLVIGMVVMGFGTSAPELLVSVLSALQGNPGVALGNAYGSNIANFALVLGCAAAYRTVRVHSRLVRGELPLLFVVTVLSAGMFWNLHLDRVESLVLLVLFGGAMGVALRRGRDCEGDEMLGELEAELASTSTSLPKAVWMLVVGLALLVLSSRTLVWGAVEGARMLGVADWIIGLTVVAIGTSLPELASTLAAIRKGEDDMAVGNLVGSNLFNTLAVVGLAGVMHPMDLDAGMLWREFPVMGLLTLVLYVAARVPRRVSRSAGGGLLLLYGLYLAVVVRSVL